MPDDNNGSSDYDALAGWDGGQPSGVSTDDSGHTSVYGQIDGQHYHISWDAGGDNLHSTLGSGEQSDWHVNH